MLTVALHLLTGRYGATEYNDRTRPEWPPHPARLFSALVAAWADAEESNPDERAALAWLECQPAPELMCSGWNEVVLRDVVTFYVPGNDASALKSAALEVLPDNRNRQPRTFPSVTPPDPTVHFVWRAASPTEAQRHALDGLLAKVARLGHSATFVSCHLEAEPPHGATLVPRAGGGHALRVPRKGLLDRLEQEFNRHQGTKERLLPAAMIGYERPGPQRREPPVGSLSGDWFLLELPIRHRDTGKMQALRNTRSLELARAVREALLAQAEPDAGVVSGLWPDGGHRPHLAVVPLASIGHRWADGTIRGVALMLPAAIAPDDRAIVERAIAAWGSDAPTVRLPGSGRELVVRFEAARLMPAGPVTPTGTEWDDRPVALRRPTWCRRARYWVSASPVALDRAVQGLREGKAGADVAAQESLARSCVRSGLPEPVAVVIGTAGMAAAVPAAPGRSSRGRRTFPRFVAAGTGQHKQCVHASLTFAEPVRGPVLIGAGRYLGYGLFLPMGEDDGW